MAESWLIRCQQWDWEGVGCGAPQGGGQVVWKTFNELKNQHRVVIAARRGEVLDQLKEELIVAGGENRAKVVILDLSSLDSLEGKAEEIIQVVKVLFGSHTCFFLQMYGQLDVLINCGGVSVRGGAVETLLEVHKRVMDTNYFGTESQSY